MLIDRLDIEGMYSIKCGNLTDTIQYLPHNPNISTVYSSWCGFYASAEIWGCDYWINAVWNKRISHVYGHVSVFISVSISNLTQLLQTCQDVTTLYTFSVIVIVLSVTNNPCQEHTDNSLHSLKLQVVTTEFSFKPQYMF